MKTSDLIDAKQLHTELSRLHDAANAIGSDLETVSMLMSKSFAPIFKGNYPDPKECDEPKAGDVITSGDSTLVCTTIGGKPEWVEVANSSNDLIYVPQDCSISTMHINNYQATINALVEKVDALSKRPIPRFNCIYCGTQNFEYSGISTTPQCPNCGALMRRSETVILPDIVEDEVYYPDFQQESKLWLILKINM